MKTAIEQLQDENAKLRAEVEQLRTHAPYGILTRAAFEMEKRKFTDGQFVVFGDIDNMHQLNALYGYETVNAKIRTALRVRSQDLLLTGLWFSGDEIVFIIQSDPEGFCNRLSNSFLVHKMSITLAHEQIVSGDVDQAIDHASRSMQAQKENRK
jgi:GGDEF domain-containing protein